MFVERHPRLGVAVCGKCLRKMRKRQRMSTTDHHEVDCVWCSQPSEPALKCGRCPATFCVRCLTRNAIGTKLATTADGKAQWTCVLCNDTEPLSALRGELQALLATRLCSSRMHSTPTTAQRRTPIAVRGRGSGRALARTNGHATLPAKPALAEVVDLSSDLSSDEPAAVDSEPRGSHTSADSSVADSDCVEVLDDDDDDDESAMGSDEPADFHAGGREGLRRHSEIMPHQQRGVDFLSRLLLDDAPTGGPAGARACILAPSGQGKIAQIVCFLRSAERTLTGSRRTLILAPAAKVLHWAAEVRQWMSEENSEPHSLPQGAAGGGGSLLAPRAELLHCDHAGRMAVRQWALLGSGLLIAAYEAFLPLSAEAGEADAARLRLGGPDIVVCDEAHVIFGCDVAPDSPMRHWPCVWEHTLGGAGRAIFASGAPLLRSMRETHAIVGTLHDGVLPNSSEAFAQRFERIHRNGSAAGALQQHTTDAGNRERCDAPCCAGMRTITQ